jgi:hypothetical protein
VTIARSYFLQVGESLVVVAVVRHHDHHRHLLVDQCDRAVLHLPRRVAFRVGVADFLQLQGPFQGDRIAQPAAQKQHVVGVLPAPRNLVRLVAALERLAHRRRHRQQRLQRLTGRNAVERAATAAEIDREQQQRRKLGGEALGRCHADFGTGVGIERAVGRARDHAVDHVRDG